MAPFGILTSESPYLPQPSRPWGAVAIRAAFVVGHSGGAVPESHRLPISIEHAQNKPARQIRQGADDSPGTSRHA